MSKKTEPRYQVRAWYSWADIAAGRPTIDREFDDRAEALNVARASDCPLVDVYEMGVGIIADRSNLRHPKMDPDQAWEPRDTIATAK